MDGRMNMERRIFIQTDAIFIDEEEDLLRTEGR